MAEMMKGKRGRMSAWFGLVIVLTLVWGLPANLSAANNTALNEASDVAQGAAQGVADEPAPAEEPAAPVVEDATPANADSPTGLPVIVEHEGEDKLGVRMAFALKQAFDKSPAFRRAASGERAIKVRITTRVEIPSRPYFGSVYSVDWLYVEGKDVLGYYLDSTLDFADSPGLEQDIEALVARTDKVATKYSYLMD